MIVNYDRSMFMVQATVVTIVNYDRNMFTVQAGGNLFCYFRKLHLLNI